MNQLLEKETEELGKVRIEKDYQRQKFLEQEKENEKKVAEENQFVQDLMVLKIQVNNFLGMEQEIEVEMENYQDEYNYLQREQQLREGNVEIDQSVMFKGLEMTDNYKQAQNAEPKRNSNIEQIDILGSLHNASAIQTDLNSGIINQRMKAQEEKAKVQQLPQGNPYLENSYRSYEENKNATSQAVAQSSYLEENSEANQSIYANPLNDPKVSQMSSYDGYIDFEAQLSLLKEQEQAGFRNENSDGGELGVTRKSVSIQEKMDMKRKLKKQAKGDGEDGECQIF